MEATKSVKPAKKPTPPTKVRVENPPAAEIAPGRPYLLESQNLEAEIRRSAKAARSEIEAIDADILSIETRANMDIESIRARADTEVAARISRRNDLTRILDIEAVTFGREERPAPAAKPEPEPEPDADSVAREIARLVDGVADS